MADDKMPDDGSAGDRPKRPPPTIDLEPSEISGETQSTIGRGSGKRRWRGWGLHLRGDPWKERLRWILPAASGALAALVVLAIIIVSGLLPWLGASSVDSSGRLNDLAERLARLEAAAPPSAPAPDSDARGRIAQVEAGIAGLRSDLAGLRKQVDGADAGLAELKSSPRTQAVTTPDLSALTERLARLEQSVATIQSQPSAKAVESNDMPWRRLAVATVLEDRVRRGAPFADVLPAAKTLSDNAAQFAPLEPFAATGVPSDATLSKDLLALVPQLAPAPSAGSEKAQPASSAQSGVVARLLASGASLVKVERADPPGAMPAASPSLAALEAAARRNDVATARSELARLPEDIKQRAVRWREAADARDAAVKAAAAFAGGALAAINSTP